ncbi:hypothetical protein AAG906_015126 [Vitis piasezkii]
MVYILMNEWSDGVEMPPSVYGDIYHHGFGYPYRTYPHCAHCSHHGTRWSNTNNLVNDGNVNGNNGPKALRSSHQNSSLSSNGSYGRASLPISVPSLGYRDPRFGFDGTRSLIPLAYMFSMVGPNMSTSSFGRAFRFMSRMYPNKKMYDQYKNAFRHVFGFGSNSYDSRTSGCGWLTIDSKHINGGQPDSRTNEILFKGARIVKQKETQPRTKRDNNHGYRDFFNWVCHMEQLEASMHQRLDQKMPSFNLPSKILFYAQVILLSEQDQSEITSPDPPLPNLKVALSIHFVRHLLLPTQALMGILKWLQM